MNLAQVFVFLPEPPPSSFLYVGSYDARLVALSLLIATFAAVAALDVADRVRHVADRRSHLAWLAIGALAMGGGIWAMHFIGMLALQLPCATQYDPAITLWSMLPGVLASAVAIEMSSQQQPGQGRLLFGGVLFGAGIGAMHYTGMAAMRIDGLVRYDPRLFGISIVVAALLAIVALQVRYRLAGSRWRMPLAALVMGMAVSGMHYTAMAATYFLRDGDRAIDDSLMAPTLLAILVSVVAGLLIALALAMTVAARHQATAQRLRDSEHRLRGILESTQEGFVQVDLERIVGEVNPAFCAMLERPREAIVGRPLVLFFTPESVAVYESEMTKRASGASSTYAVTLVAAEGRLRDCEFHGTPIFKRDGELVGSFALVTDMSAHKAHEAYQRQAVAVFENTAEGVMMTDPAGAIVSVNPAFTRITGYAQAEALGCNPSLLKSGRHDPEFYHRMWVELLATGHWQGEIWNRRRCGDIYPEWLTISAVADPHGRTQNFIGVFSDISHIKRSAEELERLAHYDPLTELANRLLLAAQLKHALERAQRHRERLAVMELDLDGFKLVNDTLGHPAGDLLLQTIARRLKATLRGEDIVARLGGDEFAVVVEALDSIDAAGRVADKIIAACAEPIELDGQPARVTCSVGIAFYPDDGDDATQLMKAADTALYVAKREGRNTFRFYANEMALAVRQRHDLEQGLRQAIEGDELELWYQPQICLRRGAVVGVEALLRWRHPQRGLMPPGDFLPVACDTGLIVPLGEWVLRAACRQARQWREAGIALNHVAVNVDGQQIMRSDLVDTVAAVLAASGVPATQLELEITEGFLLENAENGMGTVTRFSDLGVAIAIDDFGTGYSSLAYLKYLHADCLKIDKSFVQDLPEDSTSAAIIRAVVSLGHGIGFELVAEGVETAAQLAYLKTVGVDRVQGYYFSRPLPAAAFADWLRAGEWRKKLS